MSSAIEKLLEGLPPEAREQHLREAHRLGMSADDPLFLFLAIEKGHFDQLRKELGGLRETQETSWGQIQESTEMAHSLITRIYRLKWRFLLVIIAGAFLFGGFLGLLIGLAAK